MKDNLMLVQQTVITSSQ